VVATAASTIARSALASAAWRATKPAQCWSACGTARVTRAGGGAAARRGTSRRRAAAERPTRGPGYPTR
jgi:hypothetical protein